MGLHEIVLITCCGTERDMRFLRVRSPDSCSLLLPLLSGTCHVWWLHVDTELAKPSGRNRSGSLSFSNFYFNSTKELTGHFNSNTSPARELWHWAALCMLSNPTWGLMCSERWRAPDTAPGEEGRTERIGVISRVLNPAETKASHTPTVLCCHCDY